MHHMMYSPHLKIRYIPDTEKPAYLVAVVSVPQDRRFSVELKARGKGLVPKAGLY